MEQGGYTLYTIFTMQDLTLALIIVTPLITTLTGWLTNRAAIWMLFHPRRPMRLGFVRIQGLVPRRRTELAKRTAELVSSHLLSADSIERAFAGINHGPVLDDMARRLVYEGLEPRMAAIPMIGPMIVRSSIAGIHKAVLERLHADAPEFQRRMGAKVAEQLDLRSIVEEKISAFEEEKLEELVRSVAARELRGIEIAGAVLGLILGLAQAAALLLLHTVPKVVG